MFYLHSAATHRPFCSPHALQHRPPPPLPQPPPPPPGTPCCATLFEKKKMKKATWQNMIPRWRPSTPADERPGVEVKSEELWGTTVPLSFLISPPCRVVEGEVSQKMRTEKERRRKRKAVVVQTRGYCQRGRANVTSSHDWCDCVYSISKGIPTPFLPSFPPFLPAFQTHPCRVSRGPLGGGEAAPVLFYFQR